MPFKRTILYNGQSPFGRYKVVDTIYNDRPARVLYGTQRSPQSGVAKDDDPTLLFEYNQRFLELIMSQKPKRILVIGGGAFMLPIAAFHQFSTLIIDVVEIDPLLVKIGRDFFDLPDDKRLSIYVEDGAEYIARTNKRYDMIIIDAFSGYTIPGQLISDHAIALYRRKITKQGVVAINFISEFKQKRRLAHELLDTFGGSFPVLALFPADMDYPKGAQQNLLLVASTDAMHFDYLRSHDLLDGHT